MEKFRNLKLSENLLKAIKDLNFTEPSEIQEKTIPLVMEGKDVIGSSSTGSGKTLAFGAGIIEKIKHGKGIQALILAPTRELAEQVTKHLRVFSRYYSLVVAEIYGGVSMQPQVQALHRSEIIVATPGRMLDHMKRGYVDFKNIKFLVLDEADKMLEMGFIEDVQKIINECPRERQTLLFSATISKDIEHIAKRYMKNPVYVEVASYVDSSKLKQVFYDVPQNLKFSLLVHLLGKEREGLVMVFCNTRRNTDLVAKNLKRHNIFSLAIHGGLTQNKRNAIMKDFHSHKALILVCTDVAARGLDIKNLSHVYNYDISKNSKEYIHRIGRTARAGKEGIAVSLVSPRDYDNFRAVRDDDSLHIEQEELPKLEPLHVNFKSDNNDYGDRGGRRERSGGFGGRSGGFSGRNPVASHGFSSRRHEGNSYPRRRFNDPRSSSGDGERRSSSEGGERRPFRNNRFDSSRGGKRYGSSREKPSGFRGGSRFGGSGGNRSGSSRRRSFNRRPSSGFRRR
ncbi:DEAD/DEAH box helicase [Candidatus Pacearchaeota archaeon]|nr:DEAD/DEAH box helicase [Candidatus Pacearchaeota archaeon]